MRIASRSSFFGAEVADFLQEFRGQLGQLELLDVQHFELDLDLLAAQIGVRGVFAECDLGRALVAGLRALHQLGEAFELGVAEAERRANAQHGFALVGELLAVVGRRDVGRDVIAFGGRAVERHELTVAGEHLLELLIDVGIGEIAHGPLELEALPLRHVELGSHFDRELERHRPFVGHFDRFEIEIRLADRGEASALR